MLKHTAALAVLLLVFVGLADAQTTNKCTLFTNGTNSQIDIAHSTTHAPATGITVEAWITYDDASLGTGWRWPTVIRKSPDPGKESYFLRVDAANTNSKILAWVVKTSTGTAAARWTFKAGTLKSWVHVACTYDGIAARLFVNGKRVAVGNSAGTMTDNGGLLRIGNGWLGSKPAEAGIETWNGRIDEVRLWPFARTAKEIRSSANLELAGVPGQVSTWNMNGDAKDSSGANAGTASKTVFFTASALTLTPTVLTGTSAFGKATAGCAGTPMAGVSGAPKVGNSDFVLTGIRGTTTGAGFVGLMTSKLSTPIKVLGAEVWVLPGTGAILPVAGGPLNTSRITIPIPNVAILVGKTFFTQFFWTETGCKTPLFATEGLQVTVLP